ncbi:MAG: PfkB family carbohydrate kinase, partial [Elusimicrobiota bacterium]
MILVLCLNAAVDKTVTVRRLSPGRRNRIASFLALPGGKGVNVARALRSLGEDPFLLGFTAGHSGRFIEDGVRRERIAARWIRLLDGGSDPTEFNEPGPLVRAADFERLEKAYRALLPKAGIVGLSGSLPLGLPPGAYARLILLAKKAGRTVFLDTSAPALGPALRAG